MKSTQRRDMYLEHFKLKEFPFSLVSDPRYLYLTDNHAKVKAFLEYAMEIQDSFVVITGEIGTGKTTLINYALENASPSNLLINIQSTKLNNNEFLQTLLLEIGIEPYEFSRVQMLDCLRRYLVQKQRSGKKVFLIVDEAQNLAKNVMEDIRYLSDLENKHQKLLNVIIVGQPELGRMLDDTDMEHFLQRVRLRTHIKALSPKELKPYIRHRLKVAGAKNADMFDDEACKDIHQFTGGRLRLINTLCDYSMMVCFVENIERVTSWVVQNAAHELQWETYDKRFGLQNNATRMPTNFGTNFSKSLNAKAENKEASISNEAKLVLHQGSMVVGEYPLNKGVLSIGRHGSNDIPLDSHKVSRKHAQLLFQGNRYYLHDLGSTNGTQMNGKKISVRELKDGEVFTIENYHFTFKAPQKEPEKVQPTPNPALEVVAPANDDHTRVLPRKETTRKLVSLPFAVDEL